MPYSNFKTLQQVATAFQLTLNDGSRLLQPQTQIEPSDALTLVLKEDLDMALAVDTEKARSELLITPILKDIRTRFKGQISYFSGSTFNVNPDADLVGEVDFLLSAGPTQIEITAPVLTLVEAKNADTKLGLGQCAAQMVAAQQFNQRRDAHPPIWGASTTGDRWRFMRLEDSHLQVDLTEYAIPSYLSTVLGLLAEPFITVRRY